MLQKGWKGQNQTRNVASKILPPYVPLKPSKQDVFSQPLPLLLLMTGSRDLFRAWCFIQVSTAGCRNTGKSQTNTAKKDPYIKDKHVYSLDQQTVLVCVAYFSISTHWTGADLILAVLKTIGFKTL